MLSAKETQTAPEVERDKGTFLRELLWGASTADSEFNQVAWDMELPEFTKNKCIVFDHQACGDLL